MKDIKESLKRVTNEKIPSMTLVNETTCDDCGNPIKIYETQIMGGPKKGEKTEVTYGCKCEDIKLAESARKVQERIRKEKLIERFNSYSLINKKLRNKTIDDYAPKNSSQVKAKNSVHKFIEIFDINDPRNILMTGGFGVGKSHLAKVLTDGIMKKGFSAIFISVPKLLRRIRSTYNKDSDLSEDDILEALEKADVLVFDDIGSEKQTDWVSEKIFDIIDSRQGMHTIYTSNYSPDDLFELLGERNFSRIVNEDTTIIEIEGENHRLSDL